jgi:hypothetical protein
MTYLGEVRSGQVVFPLPIPLPDGTPVRVEQVQSSTRTRIGKRDSNKSPEELIKEFKNAGDGLSLGGLSIRDLIDKGRK